MKNKTKYNKKKNMYVFVFILLLSLLFKMYSFLTLMNENQLNKDEQKQVYKSIRAEYKNLLKNYDEVKRNDSSGVIQDELEMDMWVDRKLL